MLGHPLVALPIWALNLYLWHLSTLYDGVLDSSLLHLAQHACFFTFGLAMWMPLVGPLPKPAWFGDGAKLLYIVGVRLLEAVLANVLIWSGSGVDPDYAPGEAEMGHRAARRPGCGGQPDYVLDWHVTLGALHLALLPRRQPQRREAAADRARPARAVRPRPGAGRRARSPPARATACASGSSAAEHDVTYNRFLYLLVFVVGTASLGAEIAAARLMAPFFGASTIIWANTIGVVLVALSIGYWLGGRLADRRPDLRSLCLVVLIAAVLLADRPVHRPPVLRRLGRRARPDRGRRLHRLPVRRSCC